MAKNYAMKYELSSADSNFPARVVLFDKPGKDCYIDKHWHKSIEINYVIRGDLKVTVNGDSRNVANGEFAFINANDVHQTDGKYPDAHVKYLVILFSNVFLKNYFSDYEKYIVEIERAEIKDSIKSQLERISEFIVSDDDLSELHILSALINILDTVFTKCSRQREQSDEIFVENDNVNYVKNAIEYIKEHYMENISLGQVASVIGLTPSYFAKLFKIKTNRTFHTYLNDIRLRRALSDIENYDVTETEAAYNNGFPNVKSFIATFKRNYNCTPSQYIKENKKLPSIYGFNKKLEENNFK
ncbi:MAG: helix-turn-helix transcriptional regulator [Lachnospiraceae bacterium]|nr:helix-turn-helix transcriptional regulator [Lachnospiraceae bacterium]